VKILTLFILHIAVYGGETDAAIRTNTQDPKQYNYIEFKTTREIETPKQNFNFQQ